MRKVYWICSLLAAVLTLVYAFESYYIDFMFVFSNALSPLVAGAAVVGSVFALGKYWEGLGSRLTRVWACFALGMMFWFLGELIWAFHALALSVALPYPSIADGFWLVGYVPFTMALTVYLSLVRPAVSKEILGVASTVVFATGVLFSYFLIVPATLSEGDTLTRIINVAYPSLDLLLFALSILGLLVFTTTRLKGKIDAVWILLNAGVLMNVVADSLFSYTTSKEMYYDGHPLELLFHFGYISFFLAFYIHTREL